MSTPKLFSEEMRYAYDLTPDSTVIDVGMYEGNFAMTLFNKYGCRIIGFEPVPEFYKQCYERVRHIPNMIVLNAAVGPLDGEIEIGVKGDMSGIFCEGNSTTKAKMVGIERVLNMVDTPQIALLKLNCEAAEFGILEAIIALGLAPRIQHIQVQPHPIVLNYEKRWKAIDERLRETHDLKYHKDWIWSGYSLK